MNLYYLYNNGTIKLLYIIQDSNKRRKFCEEQGMKL